MLVCEAARLSRELIKIPAPERSPKGMGDRHIAFMLDEIRKGRITGEKAHRWLGYAQALMVVGNWATLDQLKEINYNA